MSVSDGGLQTHAVHGGDDHNPTPAVVSPIFQSATYRFQRPEDIAAAMLAEGHDQFYGRYASPNTSQVEATVAQLEGGEAALAVGSGMAAISLVILSLLRAGDHLVAQQPVYPTTRRLLESLVPRLGIAVTFANQARSELAAAIRDDTRLLYLETPANPILTLTDIEAVASLAAGRQIVCVVDNTFATPYNQRPLSLGADIVLHSATKYLAGHSDVVAGVIVAGAEQIGTLWRNHILLGALLHPMEAWLVERGLKTFGLRMAQHNRSAAEVAAFLSQHPAVARVHYPGLPEHPQHVLARRQMTGGYGGMVSFELDGGRAAGEQLLQGLKLVSLAVSLGGVHSLITHPGSTIAAVQSAETSAATGVSPGLIRLSVGLEDTADIVADLAQALEA